MRMSELPVPLHNAFLGRGKTAQNHSPRTGKHHGSERRRRRKKDGEKLPNVTSETQRKWRFLRGRGKTAQNHSPRTGKHHGSEGRRRRKKGGLVPLQNAVLGRGKTAQNQVVVVVVVVVVVLVVGVVAVVVVVAAAVLGRGKTAQNHSPRTGKHHGSEGRRRRKKGGKKLPNVTSETHRKWGFLSYLSRSKARFLGEERPRKTTAPGRGNSMAVKDGEGGKKAAKNCLT